MGLPIKRIRYFPIFALIIVATFQMNMAHQSFLTPWKGGGFGMFSSISERYFHIEITKNNSTQIAKFPKYFKSYYQETLYRAKNTGSVESLTLIAKEILKTRWIFENSTTPHFPDRVRIELRQFLFDRHHRKVTSKPLTTVEYYYGDFFP